MTDTEPLLAHVPVTQLSEAPSEWMLFLHGILGSKSNWRSIARRLVAKQPGLGALLVDLRMHGNSRGLAPPHTVESAARDVLALEAKLGAPVRAVLGHSFGGKVALAYARARNDDALRDVWVIDSLPGARATRRGSEGTLLVIELLRSLGSRFESREKFVEQVLAHGLARDLATFLAMNLERDATGDAFVLRLDLDAITEMLDDYFAQDLWPVVEHPPGRARIHLVVGGKSGLFEPTDLERARAAVAALPERVFLTVFPDAGHWIHTEAPDELLRLVSDAARTAD